MFSTNFKLIYLIMNVMYPLIYGCPSFNNVVHSLPYIGSPDSKCVNDRECTSINCTVSTQTSPSSVGLVLKSCGRDPSVEIHADIPSTGVNRWSATFSDGTEHIIPGYFLPDSGQKLQGYLRIDLKTLPGSQILMLSMSLKGCGLRNESHCAVSKKLLNDQYITCIARPVVPCSINIPFQCGENETCRQGTAAGDACECLMGFERSPDGSCYPLDLKEERNGTSSSESVKQTADLVVKVLLPVLLVLLIASLVVAAYKFGWIPRTRSCSRSFQVIDDDDDLPLPF